MSTTATLDPKDILTPEELAEKLKVGISWVYEKSRARGKHNGVPLPCLRLGRYLRFSWPDVVEWMRANNH
ncbi:MAG TPA: helix-turn-helix domain-containing protein [Candidatus Angelobacter sp.]|nr:helix-turn-helix domain-containing protein [Candidatus Angelobacter sp.]